MSPKLRRRPPARYRAEFRRRRGKDMWVWHIVIAAFLAAIAYAFLPHRAAAAEPLVGPAKVVSGDTLEVAGQVVRLHGIAAPEMDQSCRDAAGKIYKCGHAAMRRLFLYVGADPVRCAVTDLGSEDKVPTGHLIARCEVKSYFRKTKVGATRGEWFDVARELVLTGFVLADPKDGAVYAVDETQARAAGEGLWAGTFEVPWEWRKGK
ncbi:MAG: thermonuclease family protein [Alphaproteobacteria bacterium]|nr:thermonuclease family protein [Alphaproteobacteria bacterium]